MGRPLLCFGADLLSHPVGPATGIDASYLGPSGYSEFEPVLRYPATHLNDGSVSSGCRMTQPSGFFAIDALQNVSPDILVFTNCDLDGCSDVRVRASANADLASSTDLVVTPSRRFWVDLRSEALSNKRYWGLAYQGHPGTAKLGEFVMAAVTITCPFVQWSYTDIRAAVSRTVGITPAGVRHRRAYGALLHRREPVRFVGTDEQMAPLIAWANYAQAERWPMVFIPDEDEDDVFVVEFVGQIEERRLLDNRLELKVPLIEQGDGSLT